MNIDHVFVDLALTDTDPSKGEICGIAAIRTDYRGRMLVGEDGRKAGFSEKIRCNADLIDPEAVTFREAYEDLCDWILKPFDNKYILIAHHAELDRKFLEKASKEWDVEVFPRKTWIDTLQLVWPFAYHDMVTSREFDSICRHFGIQNRVPGTAQGDVEALSRLYWAMMKRFEYALKGEEVVRDVIGEPIQAIKSMIGL